MTSRTIMRGRREWQALKLFVDDETGCITPARFERLMSELAPTVRSNTWRCLRYQLVRDQALVQTGQLLVLTDFGRHQFESAVDIRRPKKRQDPVVRIKALGKSVFIRAPNFKKRRLEESIEDYATRCDDATVRALEKGIKELEKEWRLFSRAEASRNIDQRIAQAVEHSETNRHIALERRKEAINMRLAKKLGYKNKGGRPKKVQPVIPVALIPAPVQRRPKPLSKPAQPTATALAWSSPWSLGESSK